jgi:hypothetical protein
MLTLELWLSPCHARVILFWVVPVLELWLSPCHAHAHTGTRTISLFRWLVASQPAVLFSHIKSVLATCQPTVFFSHNKSAPATSQPNKLYDLERVRPDPFGHLVQDERKWYIG